MSKYVPTRSSVAAAVAQDFQGGCAERRKLSGLSQTLYSIGAVIAIVAAVLLASGGR